MRNIFRLITLIGTLLFSTVIHATPNPATWQTENLIGCNEKHFYTFIMERHQPGSHYQYTETLSLAQYEIASRKLVNKTVIRKTQYSDEQANGHWVKEEKTTAAFDLNKFLSQDNIVYIFPVGMRKTQWLVQADGIYLKSEPGKALLVPKSELDTKVPWFNAYSRIVGLYEINNNYYVLLEQDDLPGGRALDADLQQTIIVVTADNYNRSRQLLRTTQKVSSQRISSNPNPWQVQVGCFKTSSSAEQLVEQLAKAEFKAQISFSKSTHCHRVILIPRQVTQEAARQQAQQLQEKLNIKGYIGKVEE